MLALNVLVLSEDDALVREVWRVCDERDHAVVRISELGELGNRLDPSRTNVLLLDADGSVPDAARTAAAIARSHAGVAVVLAAHPCDANGDDGIRLVDRWRAGERVVDELERGPLS